MLLGGETVKFSPEVRRVAQDSAYHGAEPVVMLFEHKCGAPGVQPFSVPRQDSVAGVAWADAKVLLSDRQMRANGQANEIRGIRKAASFIKVVDTPYEPAFHVAPGAKVLDVQVTDGQNLRGA